MVRLLLIIGLMIPILICAQPSAVISLQPERIETGDTTILLFFVNGSNAAPGEVDFFAWSDQIPVQNILRRTPWKRSGAQWTRRFTITVFDSSSLKLPPLKVKLATGAVLETNALSLVVFPTPGGREISDMDQIRDIRREPESWLDYWLYGTAGIALLLTLIWLWWRKRRNPIPASHPNPLPDPTPIPKSAADEALRKLNALLRKQYWKHDRVKDHYVEYSFILREYLERQYQIPALEATTIELKTMLAKTEVSNAFKDQVDQVLQQADMVKYAQAYPNPATHKDIIEKAIQLISNPKGEHKSHPPSNPSN